MQKEKLTHENIKQDLIVRRKYSLDTLFLNTIALIILFVIIPSIFLSGMPAIATFWTTVIIIDSCGILAFIIYRIVSSKIKISKINKDEFRVTAEWVKAKGGASYNPKTGLNVPYRLFLSHNSGTCELYKYNKYYSWSKLGEMDSKEIYNATAIGDKLYLVHIGKDKNIVCYNAKYFEPYGFTVEEPSIKSDSDE